MKKDAAKDIKIAFFDVDGTLVDMEKKIISPKMIETLKQLKKNGIIYTSFKYGTFEGERNGRYFTDFTEEMFEEFARQISGLQIEKMWITGDVREGRGDERWLNILLRKTDVC